MAEREGICLTSMMLLVGLGMSQYSSTTKADIFLSIGLLVGRECISIDYQPAPEVTRANTENKGRDRTLEAKYERVGNGYYQDEQAWRSGKG